MKPLSESATGTLAHAHGGPLCCGKIRTQPEDFQVCEIPVCSPGGEGEHVWLHIRKRNANTEWLARQLARHAGVSPRQVGYAGLKDRQAITEQWFSVHLPGRAGPDWQAIEGGEFTILQVRRHSRKLRRGGLRGNRFKIRIRNLDGNMDQLPALFDTLRLRGIPNYYGPQRFGHNGSNLVAAGAMFRKEAGRISRHQRGLYLSAARSRLFNQVLNRRVADGSWDRVIDGDVLQLDGSRSWFAVTDNGPELGERMQMMDVHATGPLWGKGAPPVSGDCLRLETRELAPYDQWRKGLEQAGLKQDRRALRVRVRDLEWSLEGTGSLELAFELPPGAYATAVLREIIE